MHDDFKHPYSAAVSAELAPMVPLQFREFPDSEMRILADSYYARMNERRSVRSFSDRPIPLDVVRRCILTAGTAPSGAHKQPWRFALVTDVATKHAIRLAAEEEERETYANRMSDEWREALAPLATDAHKPYLDIVPAIIVMFHVNYDIMDDGSRKKNYYVQESCGIALGMLIAALHHAGLATLTHTPSPMNFLQRVLKRPENERAYMLLPVGYPAEGCVVPKLSRKSLEQILVEY